MKCLVVSVLVIVAVVFTVNCHGGDVPGEHEGSSSSNAKRLGVEETPDTELDVVPDQPQRRRRSRTDNTHQLVITDIAEIHHKEREEDHEIDSRKSKCKESSSCVIMGGSCIANASLCEGRIVAGCKGKQCQCCVPEPVNICVSDTLGDTVANGLGDIEIKLQANSEEIANLTQKLDYIIANIQGHASRCSAVNGFMSPSEDECFVFFNANLNRAAADVKCKENGLQLAKPKDSAIIWLRKYVVDTYGPSDFLWIDGQTDGTYMRWFDQEILPSSNSFWWPGQPSTLATGRCLGLLARSDWMSQNPTKGYYVIGCTPARQYLCELF